MRVSKVMQSYIREQVRAKFQPKINKLVEQAEKDEKDFRDAVNSICEKANEEAQKVLEESPVTCNSDELVRGHFYSLRSPLWDEINDLRDKAEEVSKNIIVELELGGNKQTLERLLQEIEV